MDPNKGDGAPSEEDLTDSSSSSDDESEEHLGSSSSDDSEEHSDSSSSDEEEPLDFDELFEMYAGVENEGDSEISLDSIKQWFKQGSIIGDEDGISEEQTDMAFKLVAKDKEHINNKEFMNFMETLSRDTKAEQTGLMDKLRSAGIPE